MKSFRLLTALALVLGMGAFAGCAAENQSAPEVDRDAEEAPAAVEAPAE